MHKDRVIAFWKQINLWNLFFHCN